MFNQNENANVKIDAHSHVLKNHDDGFQPYDDNGGTVAAIAGDGYAIIASDTRLISGYSVLTRNQSKLFKVNDRVVFATTGCWTDANTFTRILELRSKMYKYDHNKELSGVSTGMLISNMLYNKRFFPYYVGNVLAHVDENGKGHVYHYDPIGNFEYLTCTASGVGTAVIQSIFDNQVDKKNIDNLTEEEKKVSLDEAIKILKDSFTSATEIQTAVGDGVHLMIITKDGVREEKWALRSD